MKYVVSIVKHGFIEIEACDEDGAEKLARELKPENFDWEDGFRILDVNCNNE